MEEVSCEEIARKLQITRRHVLRQVQRRAKRLGLTIIRGRRNEVLLSRTDADALISDYEQRRRPLASSSWAASSTEGFGFVYSHCCANPKTCESVAMQKDVGTRGNCKHDAK